MSDCPNSTTSNAVVVTTSKEVAVSPAAIHISPLSGATMGFGPPSSVLSTVSGSVDDPVAAGLVTPATNGNWSIAVTGGMAMLELKPNPPEKPVMKNAGGPPNSPRTCANTNIDVNVEPPWVTSA